MLERSEEHNPNLRESPLSQTWERGYREEGENKLMKDNDQYVSVFASAFTRFLNTMYVQIW